MSTFMQKAALLGSFAASVYAHGRIDSITIDGQEYSGYTSSMAYSTNNDPIIAWSADNGDNGFVGPESYTSPDIACHKNGKPGGIAAKVAAGGKVKLQWNTWPESHHGPVLDYMAKCAGDDCSTVSPGDLSFFKIDQEGLNDAASNNWASDELIANGNAWTVTVPESLAPGQYVLRHEIIALHSAQDTNGAQNYPQCINLEVTGSGSASPEGETAMKFYTPTDPGISLNIYNGLTSYDIPGPAVWDGASSGSSDNSGSSELMTTLVESVGQGTDAQKQSSLTTIGFVCDTDDVELRDALAHHSNAILTAVVQGARKEETNNDVRVAAINALSDSIEFVRSNFDNEGERNYIMQVICEATQAEDSRIQQGSYGCLNRIMGLYYDKMRFYMEKALFGLTIQGMKSDEEDVAKLAVEFWCTVCEEEIAIEDDNTQAQAEGSTELREYFNFARVATQEVVPVLLELLAKQDEDADDNEYNTSRAAYQCLQLWAQCVGSGVMPPVLAFIEKYIRSEDWHYRDASVSAFGAIMEGPEESVLDPIVKQALPTLIGMMDDQNIHVKDSAAYALGRICEAVPSALDAQQHLPPLIGALFNGLASNPKMAASCCWSLMNLADRFAGEPGCQTNPLSPHFAQSVQSLLQVTERADADNTLRTAAYEVLNSFVNNAAGDSVPLVNELSNVILERLEKSMALQSQVVNVEDKLTLEEMQTSLASVIMAIIQRLESDIRPQSDRIMQALLSLLSSLPPKSSVPDTVFAAIGSIATALEEDFQKYMEAFSPFLYNALNNQEEPALCSMAIGLVSDITRSLGENVQPFCDAFMNSLLHNLRSPQLGNQLKPAILQCFGDIAHAIHGAFETYLAVVAQVLQQAGQVTLTTEGNYEMIDYITSLREGIMDAWDGCIVAMKSSNKTQLIVPYLDSIFDLLRTIQQDSNRTEALLRSSCGVIGDLADAFPAGDFREYFRHEFLTAMARETRANADFSGRTRDTARWAREQIKRQVGGNQGVMA